jgi:hypothetical protein
MACMSSRWDYREIETLTFIDWFGRAVPNEKEKEYYS